ncbi:transcriptional regulator [Echinicola marina]|uniref:transcriptional regulator n=1 Tax=Echinicola marina TaxID=2859768 RepID=UPI001CF63059|nr:transcriptional regulator [Echinicola marina]UCS93443.1 transcriptional regulator [Echinicola marina]
MRLETNKVLLLFLLIFYVQLGGMAQVQFVQRAEVPTEWEDYDYIVMPTNDGTIAFRTKSERGLRSQQKLQYFTTDRQLNSSVVYEFPVEDYYHLLGFDLDDDYLYVLFQEGESISGDRIIYTVSLKDQVMTAVTLESVLDMDLQEFLVMEGKAILMGMMDYRPAIQVFDIKSEDVITIQGVYQNEASILQLRKDPELKVFDVLVSKRDRFKKRSLSLMTFNLEGDKLREVKVEPREKPDMEIVEGVLTPIMNYKQVLIGPYGERKREPNMGLYMSKINEFGEYENEYYGLEDFENFYNYLPDNQRQRREKSVERAIEKGKKVTIPNSLVTREVISGKDDFLVYNDYYLTSSGRYSPRDLMYSGDFYRYAPLGMRNRILSSGGYPWYYSGYSNSSINNEYKFMAAQFVLMDAQGRMIWDNTLSLEDKTSASPGKFGEVSYDGHHLFYMYLEDDKLKLSLLEDGEVIYQNEEFELALVDENERIRDTQYESLSLFWWYDDYFLLSGKQRIRFLDETGKEGNREVFFMTKIKVLPSVMPEQEE